MPEQQQPLATAKPQVVITVQVGGQNQIYDIPTARELRDQLTLAIKATEPPPSKGPTRKKAARKKSRKKK